MENVSSRSRSVSRNRKCPCCKPQIYEPDSDADGGAIEILTYQGAVQMVWFRFLNLPFVVRELSADDGQIGLGPNRKIAIAGIEYQSRAPSSQLPTNIYEL